MAGASVIVAMLGKMTGTTYPLVGVALVFGIIQACVAVIGFNSLKVLSRVALPIKLLVMAFCSFCSQGTTTRTSGLPQFCHTRVRSAGTGCCLRAG